MPQQWQAFKLESSMLKMLGCPLEASLMDEWGKATIYCFRSNEAMKAQTQIYRSPQIKQNLREA